MFDGQALILIEEHVRRLLDMMGFEQIIVRCATNQTDSDQIERLQISIDAGPDSKLLIGTSGVHLSALQHIIRSILRRQLDKPIYINLDINGYRSRQDQLLVNAAAAAASQATRFGRTVVLKPMNAHERRLVHTALAPRSDVKTESLGQEPNRRVVVKPVFI